MSTSLDMALDDITTKRWLTDGGRTYYSRGRGSGSGSAYGPYRRFARHHPIRPQPYPMRDRMMSPEPLMLRYERPNAESGTKLYVSNLDYDVSNADVKLLFSDVGELKWYSVHYDKSGRSKGTAEVVFARQADALPSIERNLSSKEAFTMIYHKSHRNGSSRLKQCQEDLKQYQEKQKLKQMKPHPLVEELKSYNKSMSARGRGLGSIHFRGFSKSQGQGRRHGEKVTAEELDADLERYHFEAMKIS